MLGLDKDEEIQKPNNPIMSLLQDQQKRRGRNKNVQVTGADEYSS